MQYHENDAYEPDDPKGIDWNAVGEPAGIGWPEASAEDRTPEPDEVDDRPPLSPIGQHLFGMINEMNRVYVAGLEEGGNFWKPEE